MHATVGIMHDLDLTCARPARERVMPTMEIRDLEYLMVKPGTSRREDPKRGSESFAGSCRTWLVAVCM